MHLITFIISLLIISMSPQAHPLYDAIGGQWAGAGIVNYGGDYIATTTYTLSVDENGVFRDHRIDVDLEGNPVQEFRVAVEYTAILGAAKMTGVGTQGNQSIFSHSNGYCLVTECTFIYSWTTGDLAHVNVRKVDQNNIVVTKQVISTQSDIFYYMQSNLSRVQEQQEIK